GTGTYIRSIARDWGEMLGTGATLAALTRTRSSGFNLVDSLTLEEVSDRLSQDAWQPIAPSDALHHLPAVTLPTETAKRWCQGQKISASAETGICRVEDETGLLLGVGESIATETGWLLRQQVVLVQ
ncbi:MAG: tRNA pseudouridine(55) synthase TruB, partial [Microcoleus sp. SIO2G3]|nr:tRNA pseudouridine(55) synthase TruB [Microcoleus sp. SIO2G3]